MFKKVRKKTKSLIFDGIFKIQKQRKKIKIGRLIALLIFIFSLCFLAVGKIGAEFVFDNFKPLNLFKNGKFLVLIQNNAEIRSSGGFIGSYGVIEFENFEIKNIEFNPNIHTLDRSFALDNYVSPPEPLKEIVKGDSWGLRDANYNASFPEASLDILKFYQLETGQTVDGIIGFNSQTMVDLLKITGPVYLEKYDLEINAGNFYRETQEKIEKEYFENPENWVINEPKTFLKDLYPMIISRALAKKTEFALLLKKDLEEKEILLYFDDPSKQKLAQKKNWAGKIPDLKELKDIFLSQGPFDYLLINNNSISANKSSIAIKDKIFYTVSFDEVAKRLKSHLVLTRTHSGSYEWPDGENKTYTRIYAPSGSSLVRTNLNEVDITSQIDTKNEFEKTFFGYQILTRPGETNVLDLEYVLPFDTEEYRLYVQKQAGVENTSIGVLFNNQILANELLNSDKKISQN